MPERSFLFVIAVISTIACNNGTVTQQNYFPFELAEAAGRFTITVSVEDKKVMDKYHALFTSYGFSGNGYTWETLIKHILENKNSALLQQIIFDSEAGSFYAYTTSKGFQDQFAKLLVPIFADEDRLRSFAEKVRPEEMDD